MITAILEGKMDHVGYRTHSIFGAEMPLTCPNVPSEILSPRETWKDDKAFYKQANDLARKFNNNFKKFEEFANEEIMAGAPQENLKYV
jgi:phosphoenolpyruvate carboxykinase (ATP)